MKENQIVPIVVSLGGAIVFVGLTFLTILLLNSVDGINNKINLEISFIQIFLGMFIYLKTAVDYAIFVGMMMEKNAGMYKRIAMNAGTSVGCYIGVSLILVLWYFFKEINWLMFILLIISGAVLLSLGDASQEHFGKINKMLKRPIELFFNFVRPVVKALTFFMPEGNFKPKKMRVWQLFLFSGLLPFLLGADDLAGYMALMNPINVFSLLIGIYFADAIIDILLFCNRNLTIKIVKNKWIIYIGTIFFIVLAFISFYGAIKIIL